MKILNSFTDIYRNPRAVTGILLIGISLLAAIALTASVGHRATYWVSSAEVAAGEKITITQLRPLSLVQAGVPADYIQSSLPIAGKYARTTLHQGDLISNHDLSEFSPLTLVRSMPLKILKNNLPKSLQVGDYIDVYALANISGQINSSHPMPIKSLTHVKLLNIDGANSTYGSDVGITVEVQEKSIETALAELNGSNVVVVKNGE